MKVSVILLIFVLIFSGNLFAQDKQSDTSSVYRVIIPESKQSLLKNVDIIANTHMGFRSDFNDQEYVGSTFKFEQFRLEIKGYVHKKIFFRFRHRYTSSFEPQSVDKIIKGVDMAYLRFDLSDKWQFAAGKMLSDWGGIELDYNPIDIYQYSDIISHGDFFMTGISANYKPSKNHSIIFQLLDSRTGTFEELYDSVPDVTASKLPLAVVVNWNGKLFGGKLLTTWSYSLFTEAKGYGMHLLALGNQFRSKRFDIAYDFKLSFEGLDRTHIVSDIVPDDIYPYALKNTVYRSHWTRLTFRVTPQLHLNLDAFVDCALWRNDDPEYPEMKTGNLMRTVYSYIPAVEYYPWKGLNLKFFVSYVSRFYRFSDYAKNRPGTDFDDYNTSRITIGLISPLHIM